MIFWVFFNLSFYVLWVIGNNAGKEGYINTLYVFDFYENSTFEAFNVSRSMRIICIGVCGLHYTYWFMNILVIMGVISSDAVI